MTSAHSHQFAMRYPGNNPENGPARSECIACGYAPDDALGLDPCEACDGSGWNNGRACERCDGWGAGGRAPSADSGKRRYQIKRVKIRSGCYWIERDDGRKWMARRGQGKWWVLSENGPFTTRPTLGHIESDIQFPDRNGAFA